MQGEVGRGDLSSELIAALELVRTKLALELGLETTPTLRIKLELLYDGPRFDRAFAHLGPFQRQEDRP